MENANPNIATVQHVAKASSDQLLRKFAEVGSQSEDKIKAKKELRLAKRAKRSQITAKPGNASKKLADRKSLLPPDSSRKPVALFRTIGMSKTKIRVKELKNKSIIRVLEKTWRKTVESASRILMEKHYNRHKRLTSDVN